MLYGRYETVVVLRMLYYLFNVYMGMLVQFLNIKSTVRPLHNKTSYIKFYGPFILRAQ